LPIAPFVSPRDRERAWRDFRNMGPVVLPWWLWVVVALYGGALLGGIWLMADGWLIAAMVWHLISTVVLVRRQRDRTK
jgi:hypothetical protein